MSQPTPPFPPEGGGFHRIDNTQQLEQQLQASKLALAPLPLSLYSWSQVVNALALLEGVMLHQGTPGIAAEAQALQRLVIKELRFPEAVARQFEANRRFLELKPL